MAEDRAGKEASLAGSLVQGPRRITVFRHAEKTGAPGDREQSDAGRARAQTLAAVIPRQLGPIDFVIAARSNLKSERPRLTLEPFATAAGLLIDERWDTKEIEALAAAVLGEPAYAGRRGLSCWRHDLLQPLAHALGAAQARPWPADVYDRFWILDYLPEGVQFQDVAQFP